MSKSQDFLKDLQDDITSSLLNSAKAYYMHGMVLFHEVRLKDYLEYQPAVGMLSVAVELLLKAVISKKAFRHLYTNLPAELQLMLSYPDAMPKSITPRPFASELKSFTYNTVELNEAISLFYKFYPDTKQEYKPYLSFMSSVRNVSLHGALPSFQRYDLERIAYISTILFIFVKDQDTFGKYPFIIHEKNKEFVASYPEERIQRVKEAIYAAKSQSKKIEHYGSSYGSMDDWESFAITCPVCGSEGIGTGYTEEEYGGDGPLLTFYTSYFECDECGLQLLDREEIRLAGIDIAYDRTDQMNLWMASQSEGEWF